jgi:glycopeptide antibiotics resistance protein
MGFAIYNRVLTTAQIFKSYQAWMGKAPPFASADGGCLKMYLFDERKGITIHNAIDFNDTLVIPEIFKPVQRKTISPIRQGLRWNVSYVQDVMINVLGFIPFGFFFSALLLKTARHKRLLTSVAIVILGIGLSLAIELIQAYLPTRTSSLTDLMMNAIGTILGTALFHIQIKTISKPE